MPHIRCIKHINMRFRTISGCRIAVGGQHIVAEALAVRCAYSEVIAVGLELVDGDALEGPGHRVDLYIYIYVEKMYI